MKTIIALGIPLLVSAVAIEKSLDSRQLGSFGTRDRGPPKPIFSSKKFKPEIDDAAIREQLLWGPFKLTAANGTHTASPGLKLDPSSDMISTLLAGICKECMVLSAQANAALIDGSKADIGNGVYGHHIIMTDISKKGLSQGIKPPCPLYNLATSFGTGPSAFVTEGDDGAANAFMTKGSKIKRGYYVGKEDKIDISAELVNYKKENQDIYLSLTYEYLPKMEVRDKAYYDVSFSALASNPCGSPNLYPPSNQTTKYTSPAFDVVKDGYIVSINPHLHNGGTNITILVNNVSKCTSSANYVMSSSGGVTAQDKSFEVIQSYTPCAEVQVKKGDKVTLETYYDLSKHQLRPMSSDEKMAEGMAVALYFFAEPVII